MATELTSLDDNDLEDDGFFDEKPEEVTLKKKKSDKKIKEDTTNV
jgi:hypothetical protein